MLAIVNRMSSSLQILRQIERQEELNSHEDISKNQLKQLPSLVIKEIKVEERTREITIGSVGNKLKMMVSKTMQK